MALAITTATEVIRTYEIPKRWVISGGMDLSGPVKSQKCGSFPLAQTQCSSPSLLLEVTDMGWGCLGELVITQFLSGFASTDVR
jgi:hypothetical protein